MSDFIKIDQGQLNLILARLDRFDFSDAALQIGLVIFAAAFPFFIQWIHFLSERRSRTIAEAHRYNEAVIYLSSVLEGIVHHLSQLVLPSYKAEIAKDVDFSGRASNPNYTGNVARFSLHQIRPLDIVEDKSFTEKIPDIGKYKELIQVFYRMRSELLQFQSISNERSYIIKEFYKTGGQIEDAATITTRWRSIMTGTYGLLVSGEAILDECIFISYELEKITKDVLSKLRQVGIKGITVVRLEKNHLYEELALEIKSILDQDPNLIGRMLHIKR